MELLYLHQNVPPINIDKEVEMDEAFRNASQFIHTRGSGALKRDEVSSFSPRSLETFVDLGMSDRQIARYLRTSETSVLSLRRHYGLF